MRTLTRAVSALLGMLIVLCGVIALAIGYALAARGEPSAADLLTSGSWRWLVAAVWALWLVLQGYNYRLVHCGGIAERHAHAPSWINRPDLRSRIVMHLLLNWSAVATTTTVAWFLRGTALGETLAAVAASAIVLVWCWFNWQHRRMNRARNLTLSSAIALALLATCLPVLLGE